MADMTTKLTQNMVMISSLAKAPECNATKVKDCKEKIATMETEVSIMRKEVNKLQVNLRELDHPSEPKDQRDEGDDVGKGSVGCDSTPGEDCFRMG
ncbi:hypothetical protein CRENBAI_022545 [Crenichthys baileyi]|uniref:Uncharacterized protein n=1 Tax=Crenichthys baileyi TaxID=28760 RepID=A0AAV9S326_9TELE